MRQRIVVRVSKPRRFNVLRHLKLGKRLKKKIEIIIPLSGINSLDEKVKGGKKDE